MKLTSYPLCWPEGWPRMPSHKRTYGKFGVRGRLSIADSIYRLLDELRRLGVNRDDVLISTNIPARLDGLPRSNQSTPPDPGAAVYWETKAKQRRCIAIDRYIDVAQNIAAIAATLEAMRAIDRHGGAEILDRAFTGFAALAAPEQWWQVLGLGGPHASREQIERAHRELAMKHHPDRGGDHNRMAAINTARDEGLQKSG